MSKRRENARKDRGLPGGWSWIAWIGVFLLLPYRLAVTLGGRAAEELRLGTITSGAEHDFREATALARRMVRQWGMSRAFPHVFLASPREQTFLGDAPAEREYSEATAQAVDAAVAAILEEAYRRALAVLQENRGGLDRVVSALLEDEELPGRRVLELLGPKERRKVAAR